MSDRQGSGWRGAEASGGSARRLAAVLTALWLGLAGLGAGLLPGGAAAFGGGSGAGGVVVAAVAVALPVALIWAVALMAEALRELRAEAATLRAAIEAGRAPAAAEPPAEALRAITGAVDARLQELVAAQRRAERTLAAVAAQRPAGGESAAPASSGPSETRPNPSPRPNPAPARAARGRAAPAAPPATARADQPALLPDGAETGAGAAGQGVFPLAPQADAGGGGAVSVEDFLRALNFPDTPEDAEGFRALQRALADPRAARLIRAAQDVLTLLSEDGLYMDDLPPEPAPPGLWRRFARGARGGPVAALGGIDDPAALALAGRRLREDAVYRDAGHHFLRQFDRMLEGFEPNASDAELMRLADTRSARAFMLLGRAAGIFD